MSLRMALCLALTLAGAARATPYEMADLKALEGQQAWDELYEHLLDILPSKRDAAWEAVAEKAALRALEHLPPPGQSFEPTLLALEAMGRRLPSLNKSKAFLARRNQLALQAFEKSFSHYRHSSSEDPWLAGLKRYVEAEPNHELPLSAGKLVMQHLIPTMAFSFYVQALERQGQGVCKDTDVQKCFLEAAEDGWEQVLPLVHEKCAAELKPLVTARIQTAERPVKKKLCRVLKAKGGKAPPTCVELLEEE